MNGFFSNFVISFATWLNQSKSIILQNCERSELRNNLQNVSKKVITWKDDSCRVCCHNENEWNYEPFQVCHFDISSCCSLLAFSRQATNFQQPKEPVFFQKEVDNQHNGNSLWVGFSFVLRTKMYDSKWFTCMHVSTMGKTIFPKKNNFSKKKMVFNTNSIRTSLVGLAW